MTQCKTRDEHLSESGLYKLVVTYGGSWESRGLVYKVGDDKPIADIPRNYHWFVFSFIENHPNGHPMLVTGGDYQGQTVIELDTGRRRDFLPEEAKQGHGFCWTDHRFDPATKILTVAGCIWACPFEYRFYDFSDPMECGWPELEFDGAWEEGKWPEISPDGTIRTYELEREPEDAEEDVPIEQRGIAEINTYRRKGNELLFVSRWRSPARLEEKRKRAESERAYEAWEADFKATDPLYLEYQRQLKEPGLSPEKHMGIGVTHERWCPTFKGNESRWCRRIITEGRTVDLEWAVKTGPVKLAIYTGEQTSEEMYFSHTAEGMAEAFAHAKSGGKHAAIANKHPWVPPQEE